MQHTGYPVQGGKRVQLNMFLKKINQIDMTQNLKTVLMPVLWVDEVNNWTFAHLFSGMCESHD